jgi:DMSO reductase anchor subunit
MKRVAILMVGALRRATLLRFAAGVLGGIVVPLLLLFIGGPPSLPAGAVMVVLLAIGELCERSLFFRSAPASRMPGAHA